MPLEMLEGQYELEQLPSDIWKEFLRVWPLRGFVLAFLWMMRAPILSFFSARFDLNRPERGIAEVLKMITDWRVEMRSEFKAVKEDAKEIDDNVNNLRDRVSRIEGRIE